MAVRASLIFRRSCNFMSASLWRWGYELLITNSCLRLPVSGGDGWLIDFAKVFRVCRRRWELSLYLGEAVASCLPASGDEVMNQLISKWNVITALISKIYKRDQSETLLLRKRDSKWNVWCYQRGREYADPRPFNTSPSIKLFLCSLTFM